MELTLDAIKSAGAYTGAPVRKEIEWRSNDEQHKAWINVQLSSYDTAMREFEVQREGGDVLVARIVAGVVDPQGVPIFTKRDVAGDPETGEGKMCASLFFALITAVNEANGYVVKEAKN